MPGVQARQMKRQRTWQQPGRRRQYSRRSWTTHCGRRRLARRRPMHSVWPRCKRRAAVAMRCKQSSNRPNRSSWRCVRRRRRRRQRRRRRWPSYSFWRQSRRRRWSSSAEHCAKSKPGMRTSPLAMRPRRRQRWPQHGRRRRWPRHVRRQSWLQHGRRLQRRSARSGHLRRASKLPRRPTRRLVYSSAPTPPWRSPLRSRSCGIRC